MNSKNNYYEKSAVKSRAMNIFKYMILVIFSLIAIYPLLWVILTSFKSATEVYANPFGIPIAFDFDNFRQAFISGDLLISFRNSIFYSAITTVFVLFFSSMASYIIAKVYTKFILYVYFTLGIMIPVHSIILPLFIMVKELGFFNTRIGLILIYIVINLSFSIFILVSFMRNIPKELEDAARIDGASLPRIFFSIILPISRPGLATVGTFAFLFTWNDLLIALIMAPSPHLKTLNLAVFNLRGQYVSDFGLISAGLTLIIIPMVFIYIIFQEQVIKGLAAGAIKE